MTTGSADAAEAAAASVAALKRDMEAAAKSAERMATHLSQVGSFGGATTSSHGGASSASAMSSSITAQSSGMSTGYSDGQGMALGAIGAVAASTVSGVISGGFNDLRIGAQPALTYEQQRRAARAGTGDFSRFQANMSSAMNDFNVQNAGVMQADVASALASGWGSSMGGGGSVGERMVAENIGYMHTMAAYGGMNPAAVQSAYQTAYGAPAHYSAMAMGVMTYDPATGDQVPMNQIINQFYRNAGLAGQSKDQLERALRPGSALNKQLTDTLGPEGAALAIQGLRMQHEAGGQMLSPDSVNQQLGAEGTGAFGSEWTQGMDSSSMLQQSKQETLGTYANDITQGIETANETLTDMYDWMKGHNNLIGGLMSFGGVMDTFSNSLPGLTSAITSGVSGLISTFGAIALWGKFGGGGKGGKGKGLGKGVGVGGGMSDCCCGGGMLDPDVDIDGRRGRGGRGGGGRTPGGMRPVGTQWSKAGIARTVGMGALRVGGVALGAKGLYDATTESWDAATEGSVQGEDLMASDFATTVAKRTAMGGLAGTAVAPGVGSLIGGGIGLVTGIVEATIKELNDKNPEEYNSGGSTPPSDYAAEGDWNIEKDKPVNVHAGEMVLPNRIAEAVRSELRTGKSGSSRRESQGGGKYNVTINVTVQRASDSEAMLFARRMKHYLEQDDELVTIGTGSLTGAVR